MHLSKIRDTASKFATVISRILDVDVMIIDNSFVRVANTFRYVDDPPPVTPTSITGHAIVTGKVVVVSDKHEYEGCKGCKDQDECCIAQVIAVPIFFEGETVGAIDLMVPLGKHSAVFDNLEISISFLEGMADLLSSKLQNLEDYDRLTVIKKEREIILDFMEDALVYTNEIGEIVHWNSQFGTLFRMEKSSAGKNIEDMIDHPLIRSAIEGQRQFSHQEFAYSERNISFSGFLSYRIIQQNGVRYGMVFLFKSVASAYGVLNSQANIKACSSFDSFKTEDPAMFAIITKAKMVAVTEEPILISGPAGSGKSMLARAIHSYSDHAERPFIVIDCGASSSEYLEADIFGSPERMPDSKLPLASKLLIAQNGTIYFRHIDSLPLYLQARLVAIIKARTLSGLGNVAARMIFSSNEDLLKISAEGSFDEELAVRISHTTISIPALNERPADIVMFIRYFLEKYSRIYEKECGIDQAALSFLGSRFWPGNISQMERIIERIVKTTREETITMPWLGSWLASKPEPGVEAVESLEELEKRQIMKALGIYPNRDDVARVLGIGRATLYRKLKYYRISGQ